MSFWFAHLLLSLVPLVYALSWNGTARSLNLCDDTESFCCCPSALNTRLEFEAGPTSMSVTAASSSQWSGACSAYYGVDSVAIFSEFTDDKALSISEQHDSGNCPANGK